MNFASAPITFILIGINVILSLIAFNNLTFRNKLILWPYGMARNNEYYRFITSGFIHADYMHLLFNMMSLYFLGTAVEFFYNDYGLGGKVSYLLLYFLGLIIADIPSYLKNKDNNDYLSLGASGAVSAVVFACVLFAPWSSIYVYFIKMPFIVYALLYSAYTYYMSKQNRDHINHDAHLWGSLFGLIFTLVLIALKSPQIFPNLMNELTHPHFSH